MNDYILWVMKDNERYVLVQFCDEVYERRIWEVQKKFVNEGYYVKKLETLPSGMTTVEFYKINGAKEYIIEESRRMEDERR